jgi:hypothetical protein
MLQLPVCLLTLSQMAAEGLVTVRQGAQLAFPVSTTLAKVKMIRVADYTTAMPYCVIYAPCCKR